MNVQELFNLGVEFMNEGRTETAMDVWNKVIAKDSQFAPVHLNQHNIFRAQGNLVKAKESLIRFLNCPVTGMSLDEAQAEFRRHDEAACGTHRLRHRRLLLGGVIFFHQPVIACMIGVLHGLEETVP